MSSKVPFPPDYDPQKDRIEIVPYDPRWPELFSREEKILQEALGSFAGLKVGHFGSTAVPGLAAKPVIDILLAVSSKEDWPRIIRPLATLGYVHAPGAFDDAIRMFFVKGMPPYGEKRTHQIHLLEFEGKEWRRELAFRDHLRIHAADAVKYEVLKRELAAKYATDREAYTEAKTHFIQSILKKHPHG